MNASVRTFMNPKLVYIRDGDRPELALPSILEFGITAVPVLDEDHKPVGMVSLRDLADPKRRGDRVSVPALTIGVDTPILAAAQVLAQANVHHLVVVDAEGCALGMLSALDVVRALIGLDAVHPKSIEAFGRPVARAPT